MFIRDSINLIMKRYRFSQFISLVGILHLIPSCYNNSVTFSDNAIVSVQTDTVTSRLIKEDLDIGYPKEFFVADSIFLVQSAESSSKTYMWILNNNGEIDRELIKRGDGPNETPNLTLRADFDKTRGEVTVWSNPYLISYNVENFMHNKGDYCKKKRVNADFQDFAVQKISKLKDGIIAYSLSDNIRFKILKESGEIIRYNILPPVNSNLDNNPITKANVLNYGCSRAIKPDNSMFVTGSYIGAILELFHLDGDKISPASVVYIYPPVYRENTSNNDAISWISDTIIGFDCIRVTDNYIYTLLSGVKGENLISGQGDRLMSTEITIFDWEGKPIRRIKTDMQMMTFDIDENNKTGYAVALNPEDFSFNLISFPLSHLL